MGPSNCSLEDNSIGPAVVATHCGALDFSLFFEQAVLGLIPAAIFLLAFPFRLVYLTKQEVRVRPGIARIVKLAASLSFSALQLSQLVLLAIHNANETKASLAWAAVNLVVALQLTALSWFEHSRSVRPSTLLVVYLGLTVLLDIPQARTLWIRGGNTAAFILYMATLVSKLIVFILEVLEKRSDLLSNYTQLPPEATSGIINRSFLWWLNGIFRKGFRSTITFDSLYGLDDELTAARLNLKIQKAWDDRRKPERRLEFVIAICWALIGPLLSMIPPRLCLIGLSFAQPFLFERILNLLSEPETDQTKAMGLFLVAATALVYAGLAIMRLTYGQKINRFKTMFRGAGVAIIYDHALLIQDGLYHEAAAITLMSTDVDNVSSSLTEINECWARTIEVVLGVYLLSQQLGWVCVVPIILVVVSFVAVRDVAKRIGNQQKTWVDAVQKRIAMTSAMLSNMVGFRMMGLSKMLTDSIQDQRVEETEKMKGFRWSIVWQNAIQNVPWAMAPPLTFVVYAAQSSYRGDGYIDASKAFTSLSIITLLTDPAAKLLSAVPALAAGVGCVDRIQSFLTSPRGEDKRGDLTCRLLHSPTATTTSESQVLEHSSGQGSRSISSSHSPSMAIEFKNVEARPASAALSIIHDINFEAVFGTITMIAGPIASGKSTLLKSVLGETVLDNGSINISSRRIAYCSQQPWLPSTSIKAAICGPFVSEAYDDNDQQWYQSVLKACALEHDLAILPKGDSTPLGSGSTVLSGGQKQRVALARALFSRAEIFVLDDIFSALDRNTKKAVAEALFGAEGLFKKLGSTVILATHAVELLSFADHVLILDDGRVKHSGTHQQLRRIGAIAETSASIHGTVTEQSSTDSTSFISDMSSKVADANERDDLIRQTGDTAVYKYYFSAIGWPKALTFVGFSALHVFAASFSHIWLKWWSEGKLTQIDMFTALYVVIAFLNSGGIFGYAWSMLILITPTVAKKLHYILLKTIMAAPQSFFSFTSSGAILNRFSQDMSLIETPLATGVLVTITNLLGAVAEVALITSGSTYMAITIPFLMLAVYTLQHVYLRTSRQLRLLDLETRSPLYSHFLETLDGLATIRSFDWTIDAKRRNLEKLDISQRPYYLMFCIQSWLELVLDLIVTAEAAIVVALAIALRSHTNAGLLGVSLNNIMSFNGSLSSFVSGWTLLETSLGSIARLRTLELDVQPEDNPGTYHEAPNGWPTEGGIIFNNITASHNPTATALRNISLKIKPGHKVGICGRTGSGKSSLVATILRLLEIDGGSMTVDGIDLNTLSRSDIRERIVTVPQHPPILIGTVRLNVDPVQAQSDDAITQALRRVNLWAAVCARGGLDAEITESSLSQGQMQLLSLARAIVNKGKILLLDEPTSSIDVDTDEIIKQVVKEEFATCTVLTVAHRIDTIYPGSDIIVVLEDGRIAEAGPPEELMRMNGKFAKLARH